MPFKTVQSFLNGRKKSNAILWLFSIKASWKANLQFLLLRSIKWIYKSLYNLQQIHIHLYALFTGKLDEVTKFEEINKEDPHCLTYVSIYILIQTTLGNPIFTGLHHRVILNLSFNFAYSE